MAQPAQVAVEEGAQVWDAVFQHGDAVDADAEGEALVDGWINACGLQHFGVDHAAAQDLQPIVAFANFQRAVVP